MSPQTEYDVQGNPIVRTEQQSDEDFTSDQIAAIEVCAANITDIVEVANQGPVWLSEGTAAAQAAAQSAANAQTAASTAGSAASSAGGSASAASASSTAAATSSSQAATSASGAQTSAAAASASADRAEAAASSNPNNPLLVPGDGGLGDTLYRTNSTGTTPVGAWGATRKNLVDFDDVDYNPSVPAEGDRLTWTGGSWKPRTATSSTSMATLSDVQLTGLADLQQLRYDFTAGKWKNFTPIAGAGGPTYIQRGNDFVGPLVHDIAVADFDVFYKCAVGAGDVTLNFPQGLTVPAGYRSQGFGKLTGADGIHKVKFTGGAAPPIAMGTFGTVISKAASAATPATTLTNAQNVVQTFTIPTGLKCRLAIAYIYTIPGPATDASDSPGFIWNGVTADPQPWDYKDVAATTRIRACLGFMALGDIPAAGLPCTWQPQWTDYGGNRVQSYIAMFIPFYGAELTDVDGIVCRQVQPNSTVVDPVLPSSAIGGPFRMVTYVVGRRSASSTDGFVVLTGCTQDLQSNGGNVNKITDNVSVSVGHEAAVAGTDSTCHAANQTGTGSFPWVDIHFAFISAYTKMGIRTRNDKAAEIIEANQFFGWLYDPEQNIVDMIF